MDASHPTMIGCPACDGCLSIEEGPHDHRLFVCSVGHAFALRELYEAKETQLERSEWSTMALLRHLQMILGMLLESSQTADTPPESVIRRRLDQIGKQIASIRQVIEDTTWANWDVPNPKEVETGKKVEP